jgi:predicted HicB family RNase H-like nuclease
MSPRAPRRRGRPGLASGPAASVRVRLPPELHDRACRVALRSEASVSEIVRRALRAYLRAAIS